MMSLLIGCRACEHRQFIEAEAVEELAMRVTSALVALHSGNSDNHGRHDLFAELGHGEREIAVRLECSHPGCPNPEPVVERCEPALAPVVAIVYHAAHEGHRIRVTVGERSWQSQGFVEPSAKRFAEAP